jgi:HD-like signal output (HDOD) protein
VGEQAIPSALEALKRLAPLPAVASRLVTLLSDEDTNFQRVAAVLDTDAALVAEVLRLANSPLIGLSRRVSTTLQALAILGLRRVYSLIVTLTLCRFLRIAADAQPAMRLCWRHNLATALLAKQIALKRHADPDHAYLAGLLHDIGKLALLTVHPREYNRMAAMMASGEEQRPCCEVEREWFGIDHCRAGEWLLETWNLPRMFREVARDHHLPQPEATSLTAIVQEACAIAAQLGFASDGSAARPEETAGLPREWTEQIVEAVNHLECEYGLTSITAQGATENRRSA